ncbi:response regulator transcription factor [Caulobacter sp. KR2-114]|uniref:response regulator transcription factor n=1 Tax=Caulobacter sp. KR2-114 TaxID=3400912 RepID=UPI003C11387E
MARVLVAEDEAFTAIALVDTLERQGHQVRDAADGAHAISMLDDFQPDVVVTDLMMPNVDGAELIRHVHAQSGPRPGVILITGVPEAKLPDDLAYDAYLGKPIDHAELGRMVEALARK